MNLRRLFVLTTTIAVLMFWLNYFGVNVNIPKVNPQEFADGFLEAMLMREGTPGAASGSKLTGAIIGAVAWAILSLAQLFVFFFAWNWAGREKNSRG